MLGVRVPMVVDVFPQIYENMFPHLEWLEPRQEVDDCLVDRTVTGLISKMFDG